MAGRTPPFAAFEWMIAWRYLRARRSEGGISVMTWISLIGITLAVFALIATLAVRSGFRAEFVDTILGANAHVTIYQLPLSAENRAADRAIPDYAAMAARIAEVRKDGLTAYAMGAMARMFGRNHAQITGVDAVRDMLIITAVEGRAGCAAAIAGTDFYTPQPDPAHIGHRRSQ